MQVGRENTGCLRRRRRWVAVATLAVALALAATLGAVVLAPPALAGAPTLTVTAARDTITAGQTTSLTAQIDVPGAVLAVSRATGDSGVFLPIRTVTAGATGAVTWDVGPRRTSVFRVAFAGDDTWDPAIAEVTVSVRPRITLTATKAVYEGWKVKFVTAVTPAHPGATVELQQRVDGVWTKVRAITLNDASRAVYRWTSSGRGSQAFRMAMAADADHVEGASPRRFVQLRDPNPYRVPTNQARFIVVDTSKYKLFYHENGRIVRVFDCVLGKPSTPTPLGRYRIYAMDTDVSGPYGPRRMRYMGLYAIHGTNEPGLLSHFPRNYSHGCTRLANTNILWLFERCRVGTPVWNVP